MESKTIKADLGSSILMAESLGDAAWRPIETAPTETPIWLHSKDDGTWIGERHYDSDGWLWGNCYMSVYCRTDGTWASNDCQIDDDYQPTHWMPLPRPPASA